MLSNGTRLDYLPQLSAPTYFVSTVPESERTMPKSFVHEKVKPLLGYFKDYNKLKAQHNHRTVVHTCQAFAGIIVNLHRQIITALSPSD